VILLSYDSKHSNEAVRGVLWSRLLQMAGMALFFVLFLWLVRVRLIKPVLQLTETAADVANGKPYHPPRKGGPLEMSGLSAQIGRVGEYIEESKRIENELRHKMFHLKESRTQTEAAQRSQSEFLAYICQEMRTPLNNIIGGAQVMKDQLYGPLENRKYRQYAADTYVTGNALLERTQELLTLSKAETGYIDLEEKSLDLENVVNKAVRFLADKMQGEQLNIKIELQEPTPRLVADEFRLQQILMNLLLYALESAKPGSTLWLETRTLNENRERKFFAFLVGHEPMRYSESELLALAEKEDANPAQSEPDIGLELVKSLVRLHHGKLVVGDTSIVFLGGNRIRFNDEQEPL